MTSTSDPSKAIHELQPWQVNQEKPQLGLSALSHKDVWGREIAEPDLTNPTRSRWERPLDTIRSFQEAVDRGYGRSYYGSEDFPVSSPPSQTARSVRNDYQRNGGGGGGGYYDHPPMPNRMGGSGTPITNASHEELASFGAMSGRATLSDSMVAGSMAMPGPNRTRGHSGGSGGGGYADTGYGESVNQLSRGGSAGNPDLGAPWKDNDNFWPLTNGNGYPVSLGGAPNQSANPYAPYLPPQQQQQQQQQQQYSQPPVAKPVIRMSASNPPPAVVEDKKKKSWLGRRLSKK